MDFFLLLIFDPEPEEVVFLCILSMFYIFNKKRIKSIAILFTGATERYILFLYPFLDYMRPKTRNDKKKKITIRILFKLINRAGVIHEGVQFHFFYYTTYIILKNKIEDFVVESNFGIKDK
ncbi:hypothetical protein ACJX0J_002751 [Zea mays]